MRFRTAGENTILSAALKSIPAVKVEIKNATGSYLDWFAYLIGVNWGASIDQPIGEVRLQLRRDNGPVASLAPFRGDSTLNIGGAAIDAGRDIKLSPATTAWNVAPAADDYKLLFIGKTADIDFANEAMEVLARDLGGTLVKTQIKTASEFKSEAGEPLEDVMQAILETWAPGTELYTPFPPGFLVKSINWGKGSLFEALRTAAGSIGWDVRYLWDNTTSQYRLTLFAPDRTKTVPDWTFAKNRILKVTQLRISSEFVRNYIVVGYMDTDTGQRESVTSLDQTSIDRFGEQWMEIEEADDSPINTAVEAQALADAALMDLAWPIAEKQIEIPFFWPVEIGDLIRFTANDIHSDEDIDLAVTGIEHRLGKEARTVLTVRGKPAGFYKDWIRRSKAPRPADETENDLSLIDFRETINADVSVTYSWIPGAQVETVFVYDKLVTAPFPDDPWPTAAEAPTAILPAGTATYEALVPLLGQIRFLHFEPRASAAAGYKVGTIRRAKVGAPAPVISAVLDAVETNALVDLTLQVRATPQAYPITATVYENTKTGTLLATHVFTADATITKLDYATLGSRAAASADKKFWYAKLVDVAGGETWVSDFVSVPGTGSIKLASQFAAALVPPEIVAVLPTLPNATYPAGRIVVLTTDGKLYRSTGTTWTAEVPAVDLTGQITTTQITDDAITTPKIAALAVTANEIAANAITAGKIAVDAVTAGTIAAGAISTSALFVAGVVDADAIDTDAVTAIKIAANSITAVKIGAGEVTADKLDVTELSAITAETGLLVVTGDLQFEDTNGDLAGEITHSSSGAGQSTVEITAAFDVRITLSGTVASGIGRVLKLDGAIVDCPDGVIIGAVGSAAPLYHKSDNAGFFNTTPIAKPTVTGSRAGNAALASLLTQLANLGLITNSTT